jgi:hypothetical protein
MSAFDALADDVRWVAWRNELRGKNSKPTKVPYCGLRRKAEADDPTTWLTRAAAERLAPQLVNGSGGGVGIELGDLGGDVFIGGVDLDSCIDEAGRLAPWAEKILAEIDTYAEQSPSGRGVKALFYLFVENVRPFLDSIGVEAGKWGTKRGIPGLSGADHGPGVEIYLSHRYFAVTEQLFPGQPDQINTFDQAALERLAAVIPKPGKQDDKPDTSRSRNAASVAGKLYHAGKIKTLKEMIEALRNDPDPGIQAWIREKADTDGGRQFRNIWKLITKPRDDSSDPIAKLNKTFAVIRVVNRAAILNEHLDAEGRPTFSLLSPDGFKLLLANQTIGIPGTDKEGNPIIVKVPLAPYWIKHSRRRQHEGITFAPQGAPPGYFNLWNGLAVSPSERGSCELFKAHLRDNVCGDDATIFNWLFAWFADIFQNPAAKCETALSLRGDEGVGKTIVGETFGHLLGLHYCQVADPRYVTGRFNAHLVRSLLFHCDEAFWAGDKTAEGKIKDLISGKRHPIELKGFEAFWVPNYVRVFVNGNADWIMPAGKGARRPAVLDVADTHKEDTKYFAAIVKELRSGGYERLLHELLTFDLSSVDIRHVPKTEALLDQKIASLSAEDGWWLDILRTGQLPHLTSDAKPGVCPAQALFDHYIEHAAKHGIRRRSIETALSIFLFRIVPGLVTYPGRYTIKDADAFSSAKYGRGALYTFPSLEECRGAFAKGLHQSMEWPKPTEWETQT